MKLSRTNGRGLDLFQQPTHGQLKGSRHHHRVVGDRWSPLNGRNRGSDSQAGQVACRSDHVFTSRPHARDPGDSSGEATPVPIPNTEVKLSSAEDTQGAAPRENRPSPGSLAFHGPRRVRPRPARMSQGSRWPDRLRTAAVRVIVRWAGQGARLDVGIVRPATPYHRGVQPDPRREQMPPPDGQAQPMTGPWGEPNAPITGDEGGACMGAAAASCAGCVGVPPPPPVAGVGQASVPPASPPHRACRRPCPHGRLALPRSRSRRPSARRPHPSCPPRPCRWRRHGSPRRPPRKVRRSTRRWTTPTGTLAMGSEEAGPLAGSQDWLDRTLPVSAVRARDLPLEPARRRAPLHGPGSTELASAGVPGALLPFRAPSPL